MGHHELQGARDDTPAVQGRLCARRNHVLFSMSSTHGKTFSSRSFGSLLSARHLCSAFFSHCSILPYAIIHLAARLFENYRTESEYRTYVIINVFSFRFVSCFATLYYYAFASSIVSEEEEDRRTDLVLNGV